MSGFFFAATLKWEKKLIQVNKKCPFDLGGGEFLFSAKSSYQNGLRCLAGGLDF